MNSIRVLLPPDQETWEAACRVQSARSAWALCAPELSNSGRIMGENATGGLRQCRQELSRLRFLLSAQFCFDSKPFMPGLNASLSAFLKLCRQFLPPALRIRDSFCGNAAARAGKGGPDVSHPSRRFAAVAAHARLCGRHRCPAQRWRCVGELEDGGDAFRWRHPEPDHGLRDDRTARLWKGRHRRDPERDRVLSGRRGRVAVGGPLHDRRGQSGSDPQGHHAARGRTRRNRPDPQGRRQARKRSARKEPFAPDHPRPAALQQ